jgi:tRNA dimethylallyltransferase
MGAFLHGRLEYEDAFAQMVTETKRLAKRQLTWLRAEPDVQWFSPLQTREITTEIEKFWQQTEDREQVTGDRV